MAIQRIAIIGSGQMGRGIAQIFSMAGYFVFLYDLFPKTLSANFNFIKEQFQKGVAKRKWTLEESHEFLEKIQTVNDVNDLKNCDFMIEAVTENKEIKLSIFRELDQILKAEAIMASNTSSISITELASVTERPEKVIGMHFMHPVVKMPLVEAIRGLETDDHTLESVVLIVKKINKIVIEVEDLPGFAVNRILMPMINEAIYVLFEGVATEKDIDNAMKLGTNMPMGPLELADFIGLDTCLSIMTVLHNEFGDPKYRPCPLLKKYVLGNRLGIKSKRGFYEYPKL